MTISNEIIEQLISNQTALHSELRDVRVALEFAAKDNTKHFKTIYERIKMIDDFAGKIDKKIDKNHIYLCQHIANLQDILHPIEGKIFPNASKIRKRLKSLLGPKQLAAGEKLDKRKR